MLVSLQPLMREANRKSYAVGAFNCPNLESVRAIIAAAEDRKMPVILNYAQVHAPFIGMEEMAELMLFYAKKAKVPVCVHLDHGDSAEICRKAVELGFTSVMIDASAHDYAANVKLTREVVEASHAQNVTVEAELGHIFTSSVGASENLNSLEFNDTDLNDVYTDPLTAKDFVEKTGVDVLAIAFGTTHGIYTKKPVLDLNRIRLIKDQIDLPFVMHGGSGLSKYEFQTAIKNGIRKINYYTYMTLAGGRAVKNELDKLKADENVFYHDIPLIALDAMQKNVAEAIDIFSMRK